MADHMGLLLHCPPYPINFTPLSDIMLCHCSLYKKRPGRVSNGPENGIQILQRVWSMELRYELGHGSLDTPCGQDLNLFSLLL